jgi:hypothetical protein
MINFGIFVVGIGVSAFAGFGAYLISLQEDGDRKRRENEGQQ